MFAEHNNIKQGICAKSIRAVHRHTGTFTRRKQTRYGCTFIIHNHLAILVRRDATHRIVCRRLDRHHLGDRINSEVDTTEIHNVRNLLQDRVPSNFVGGTVGVGTSILGGKFIYRLRANIQMHIILSIDAASLFDLGEDGA